MAFCRAVFALAAAVPVASAFLMNPKPTEHLGDYAKTLQKADHLDITFKVNEERKKNTPALSLQGLKIALGEDLLKKSKIKMPGFNGEFPSVSSGIHNLDVLTQGSFIDMVGQHSVEMNDGCWELVWKERDMAGSLICGFDVPAEAHRNGAVLPKGVLYLNFHVWTHEGLAAQQARMLDVSKRATDLLNTRDEEIDKMHHTANPFSKIWHYRNAAVARNEYLITRHCNLKDIVPKENGIIEIPGGLLLSKTGTVWSKRLSTMGDKVRIGTAQISEPRKEWDQHQENTLKRRKSHAVANKSEVLLSLRHTQTPLTK